MDKLEKGTPVELRLKINTRKTIRAEVERYEENGGWLLISDEGKIEGEQNDKPHNYENWDPLTLFPNLPCAIKLYDIVFKLEAGEEIKASECFKWEPISAAIKVSLELDYKLILQKIHQDRRMILNPYDESDDFFV